jgi:hypothetical protein
VGDTATIFKIAMERMLAGESLLKQAAMPAVVADNV